MGAPPRIEPVELSGPRIQPVARLDALCADHRGAGDSRGVVLRTSDHRLLEELDRVAASLALKRQMAILVTRPNRVTVAEDAR